MGSVLPCLPFLLGYVWKKTWKEAPLVAWFSPRIFNATLALVIGLMRGRDEGMVSPPFLADQAPNGEGSDWWACGVGVWWRVACLYGAIFLSFLVAQLLGEGAPCRGDVATRLASFQEQEVGWPTRARIKLENPVDFKWAWAQTRLRHRSGQIQGSRPSLT